MSAPWFVDCGGLRTRVVRDHYPDGRLCYVASHPDVDGMVAYHEDFNEAARLLGVVRAAWRGTITT